MNTARDYLAGLLPRLIEAQAAAELLECDADDKQAMSLRYAKNAMELELQIANGNPIPDSRVVLLDLKCEAARHALLAHVQNREARKMRRQITAIIAEGAENILKDLAEIDAPLSFPEIG